MNINWRDLHDAGTDTHVRASAEVLGHIGKEGVFQVAQHLKARNPPASERGAAQATGYLYTANGLPLVAGAFLLQGKGGSVTTFLICTREQWGEHHPGQRAEPSPA